MVLTVPVVLPHSLSATVTEVRPPSLGGDVLVYNDERCSVGTIITARDSGQLLFEHGGIALFELSKFAATAVETEEQRWLKFFKEGDRLDADRLPDWMQTHEMRQAMSTLKRFSDKERAYDAYQARQNYLRVQGSIARRQQELEAALAQERAAREAALREIEAERQAKEAALCDNESERQARETERQGKEAERQAKEAALQEKEAALAEVARLQALLRASRSPDEV